MIRSLLSLLLSLAVTPAFASPAKLLKHSKPIPESYIVILEPVSAEELDDTVRALVKEYRVTLSIRPHDGSESVFRYSFQGFSGTMRDVDAERMATDPRVTLVEQNARLQTAPTQYFTEAEPMFNLDRIDQSTPVQAFNRSYSYTTTGSGVYIYILDSGVERNHVEFDDDNDPATPQLAPRVLDGANFTTEWYPAYNPCSNVSFNDYRAGTHGTAVASVAAGKNVGVAKGAFIVPVKVGTCAGGGTLEWMCWGLDWIAGPTNPYPKKPAVCSISMYIDSAAPWDTSTPISSFEATVNNVIGAGIAVVVSANNQANSNCTTSPARMAYGNVANYPSTYRVISVGGTDEHDHVWRCAEFNDCNVINGVVTDPGSNTGPCVDLYAPAHNLKLAWNTSGTAGYSRYRVAPGQRSGTSFTAPLVAGVAARLLQSNPNLTPGQVYSEIVRRAKYLPLGFDGDGTVANDRMTYCAPIE